MAPTTPSHSLARATAVSQLDPSTFAAELLPAFCIGSVPNGGYVASIFLRTARVFWSGRRDVVAVHWQFLSRTRTGRAVIHVDHVKAGRAISVLHLSLRQDGLLPETPWFDRASSSVVVAAYMTCASLDAEVGISLATDWEVPRPPPGVNLGDLICGRDPRWRRMWTSLMHRQPLLRQIEFFMPRAGHALPATQDFWIRFASGELFTDTALGFVVDLLSPLLIESYRPADEQSKGGFAYTDSFWYPTLTMSLDVKKRLPPAGAEWLRLRAEAAVIRNGRFDSRLFVFDADGHLIAWSGQVAMVVNYERNLAKPSKMKI
ncbi:thioesterase family protein [Ophiocordyceps camponoti-floridani]|uniref:Thioesterase family protein n=1 Tax=Ophiocordyceps camponoti-floridani TaxID=2030778 RepID=A0A8H4QDV8_9HYPO|nr:thioesterase family protein [Ophiocordyceps camponoti-floridani]